MRYPDNKTWTRIAQNLFLGILSLLPFLLLEAGLRFFDYGYSPRLYLESPEQGLYVVNEQINRKYFPPAQRAQLPEAFRFSSFPLEKPAGVYRIFCLGGSTTAGDFPELLQELINRTAKGKRAEVINLGAVSLNSFQMRDFVEEIVDYQPDLLVIYADHNEFFGPMGVGSTATVSQHYALAMAVRFLQDFRLFQLVQNNYLQVVSKKVNPEERAGVFQSFVNSQIAVGSPLREMALSHFRRNLQETIQTAEHSGVPLVLTTVVSNVGSFKPFDSQLPPDAIREEWKQLVHSAVLLHGGKNYPEAEAKFRQAIRLFPNNAQQYFDLGNLYAEWGKGEEARSAFLQARELDVLPFRAPEGINRIIREEAASSGVMLVDVEKVFEVVVPNRIIGKPIMFDHIHPTRYGHYLIATGIASELYRSRLLQQQPNANVMSSAHLGAMDIMRQPGQFGISHVWPFSINNADYRYP